ncbi:hypothetical protein DW757_08005 [Clostridium sp. AM29-11AC]|nr:hypothetical protein DW757_08005 [Clostridium sp. AM29-11AC]
MSATTAGTLTGKQPVFPGADADAAESGAVSQKRELLKKDTGKTGKAAGAWLSSFRPRVCGFILIYSFNAPGRP